MRRAWSAGEFGFRKSQSNSATFRDHLARAFGDAPHEYTSLLGGKRNIKTTRDAFHESYARDALEHHMSLVEKPLSRDRRLFVLDLDDVPPELERLADEVEGVVQALMAERLEGVTVEDIVDVQVTESEYSLNAHIIWRSVVVDERTAKYLTSLLRREMTTRYPEHDWVKIIDACVSGGNGLRMPWSYKAYAYKDLMRDYPDIWADRYDPDDDGKPRKNCYEDARGRVKPYLLPNLDKGVYVPKDHEGPPTAEAVSECSILVDENARVFAVKDEYFENESLP